MTTVPMLVMSPTQVAVPPGRYFLGDPCYAVPDKGESTFWMSLLRSCAYFGLSDAEVPDCAGRQSPVGKAGAYDVVAFHTAYGDGTYTDQHDHAYPVDAGMIGLVPMGLVEDANAAAAAAGAEPVVDVKWLAEGGQIVTFETGVLAETDGEGRLRFGTFEINTSDDDETTDTCPECGYGPNSCEGADGYACTVFPADEDEDE